MRQGCRRLWSRSSRICGTLEKACLFSSTHCILASCTPLHIVIHGCQCPCDSLSGFPNSLKNQPIKTFIKSFHEFGLVWQGMPECTLARNARVPCCDIAYSGLGFGCISNLKGKASCVDTTKRARRSGTDNGDLSTPSSRQRAKRIGYSHL